MERLSPSFVLASDLDGTLIPAESQHYDALQTIEQAIKELSGELVFATGRHLESIIEAIEETPLPAPEFIIADVGTSIYQRTDNEYRVVEQYNVHLRTLLSDGAIHVKASALGTNAIRVQEDWKQGPFKFSFYFDANRIDEVRESAAAYIESRKESLDTIISIDPFNGDGLLDFVPGGVSKAHAVQWWVQNFAADVSLVIFAGDSGNDTAALSDPACHAIVVSNASEELKQQIIASKKESSPERLYLAEQSGTSGVLEGLNHYLSIFRREPSPAQ